jgi:hypothetical protein
MTTRVSQYLKKLMTFMLIAMLALFVSCARDGNNNSPFGESNSSNSRTTTTTAPTAPIGTAAPTPGTANNDVNESPYARAFNKLRGASSYHFALKTDGLPGGMNADTHITAEGVSEASTRSWQYKVTGTDADGPVNKELIKINSTNKNYTRTDGAWVEQKLPDFTDVSVDLVEGSFAPTRPDMNRMGLPQMVGTETIDGQECEHYHFEVAGESMFKGVYDAYLSKASGEFIRLDMKDSLNKFTLKLSQLNAPVTIEQPN